MKDSTVINALDLKEIYQSIDGKDMENQVRSMLAEDKLKRQCLSKDRVKNWDNTLSGIRRKKLAGRNQRVLAEEEKRKELDDVFAAESRKRDQEVIDKTKRLQYFGSDLVKNFHSRIMLLEVLQERDMQVQRKKQSGSLDGKLELHYSKISTEKLLNGLQEEAIKEEKLKAAKVQIAQEQMKQFQAKQQLKKAERQQYLLEGKKIAEADHSYKTLQKELESKRRNHALSLRTELVEMKKDVQLRREEKKKKELEYEAKINAWRVRKDLQNQKKKELEDKMFQESLNRSLALGETQALISSNADAKLNEQIAARVKERESSASKELEENLIKKQKMQAEIRHFYNAHNKDKAEKKASKKEADRKELEEYLKLRDDHLAKKELEKSEKLKAGKVLQSFHKSQILTNEAAKSRQYEAEKNQEKILSKLETEDGALKEYMISVSKEPWASRNSRLQSYIKGEVSAKSRVPRLADKYRVDTRARLGFDAKFDPTDFLRTNPIVTGNVVLYK